MQSPLRSPPRSGEQRFSTRQSSTSPYLTYLKAIGLMLHGSDEGWFQHNHCLVPWFWDVECIKQITSFTYRAFYSHPVATRTHHYLYLIYSILFRWSKTWSQWTSGVSSWRCFISSPKHLEPKWLGPELDSPTIYLQFHRKSELNQWLALCSSW